jgi:hypothetical protein
MVYQQHPSMKEPRFVEIHDPYELNILLQRQSNSGVPALYQRIIDKTYWAVETDLTRWRQTRISHQSL